MQVWKTPSWPAWLIPLGWMFLGIGVGVALGTVLYLIDALSKGFGLGMALRGNVDEGYGILQALALLGTIVGGSVGLVAGLATWLFAGHTRR
jgi:hypothetical protein